MIRSSSSPATEEAAPVIATAALNVLGGDELARHGRTPEIVADAAVAILKRDARSCTGNFFIDDEVLAAEGVTDFDQYAVSPGTPLMPDFFVPAPGARTVVGPSTGSGMPAVNITSDVVGSRSSVV